MSADPRFLVLDNWAPVADLDWPTAAAPWVLYKSILESKHTLHEWQHMPHSIRATLAEMLLLPAAWLLRLTGSIVPDASLWGAGCHQMNTGDHLSLHMDSSHHRWSGLERRANAILFLSPWQRGWGGQLRLYQDDRRGFTQINPEPGKLVLFESGMPHCVMPVTCPIGYSRRSLAVYFWGESVGTVQRPRALFLPMPGEEHDPVKDQLRRERATVED